jgi:hypothetical protein
MWHSYQLLDLRHRGHVLGGLASPARRHACVREGSRHHLDHRTEHDLRARLVHAKRHHLRWLEQLDLPLGHMRPQPAALAFTATIPIASVAIAATDLALPSTAFAIAPLAFTAATIAIASVAIAATALALPSTAFAPPSITIATAALVFTAATITASAAPALATALAAALITTAMERDVRHYVLPGDP